MATCYKITNDQHQEYKINVTCNLLNAYKQILSLGLELNNYSWNGLNKINDLLQIQILGQTLPKLNDKIYIKHRHRNVWYIPKVQNIELNLKNKQYRLSLFCCDQYPLYQSRIFGLEHYKKINSLIAKFDTNEQIILS